MRNLLMLLVILGATACGAGLSEQWAKAFSGDKVEKFTNGTLEFYYNKYCKVPGPGVNYDAMPAETAKKVEKAQLDFDDIFADDGKGFDIFGSDDEATPEKAERLKETLDFCEKQLKAANKRLSELSPDADELSVAYAEGEAAKAQCEVDSAKAELEACEAKIKSKAGEKDVKAEAEEPAVKEDVAKKTVAEEPQAGKKAAKKPAKKVAGKKAGPAEKTPSPMHDEPTLSYYRLKQVAETATEAYGNMQAKLSCSDLVSWENLNAKVYVVTDLKQWKALSGKDEIINPARNIRYDSQNRAFLMFASPAITNCLENALGYAVAKGVLEEYFRAKNRSGALCEALVVGLCADSSKLQAVVEPTKILNPDFLLEEKLLLPSEIFSFSKAADSQKMLYFLRQSSRIARYLSEERAGSFSDYIAVVKDGNSGFRSSFQYLKLDPVWASTYDEFCGNMSFRLFYPLTKDAITEPAAMQEWQQAIAEDNAEYAAGKGTVNRHKGKSTMTYRRGVKHYGN